jgi:O-antigen/teichoic acid export membrane protein
MSKIGRIKSRIELTANNEGFRRYFFNTGWMFAEKALRLVAGLFIGAYVARYLAPAQYGLLNYVISLVSLLSVFATFGLESIVIRELVKDERKRDVLLGTAFMLRLIGALTVFVLLIVINESTGSDPTTKKLVYIIGCGTLVEIFGVIDYFFQSKVMAKYVVWSQMIALSGVSVFRIMLVINEADITWFAWTTSLDFLILSIGLIYFYTKNSLSLFSWRFERATASLLLRNSWPLIFSSLAVTIYMKIDQVMIKWMLGDVATGNYGVAVRLGEMWSFIPLAICGSVFPAILNAKAISEELYLRRLQRLYDLMILISVSIALPMTFLSDFIVNLLFGSAYNQAGPILSLYVWASVFIFLGVANGKWIISENLQVFRMVSLGIAALINVVLNYFLIRKIGLYGAAISTLISYAFASYFSLAFTKRTRPMFISCSRSLNVFALFNRLIREFR